MTDVVLCENCLDDVERTGTFPVGNDKGPQHDTYRTLRTLCEPCAAAVETGDWATVYYRYRTERTVTR